MLPEEREEVSLLCRFPSSPFNRHLNTVSEKGDSVGGGDGINSLLPLAVAGFPSRGLGGEERDEIGSGTGEGKRNPENSN